MTDFSSRFTEAVLHFAWQGTVIAVVVMLGLALMRRASARVRHAWSVLGLLALASCVPITMLSETDPGRGAEGLRPRRIGQLEATVAEPTGLLNQDVSVPQDVARPSPPPSTRQTGVTTVAPYVVAVYGLGVLAMAIRLTVAIWGGARLRRSAENITDPAVLESFTKLVARVGLRFVPKVASCERATVPAVVGFLRPAILLPLSVTNGLPADQWEALILHELAHVRRGDALINVFQRLVEALLFFHPAVWLLSRQVTLERENACDDIVLATGCPRLAYADALVRMAESAESSRRSQPSPSVSVAATGQGSTHFRRRVLRILNIHSSPAPSPSVSGAVSLAVCLLVVGAFFTILPVDGAVASFPGASVEDKSGGVEDSGSNTERDDNSASPAADAPQRFPRLLADLRKRDTRLDNRSLQVVRQWVENVRTEDGATYEQPHRVPYQITVRSPHVWSVDHADDWETPLQPKDRGPLQAKRWPIGPRHNSYNSVMVEGAMRLSQHYEALRQFAEWSCGFGFARSIVSINSVRTRFGRTVLEGRSRIFLYGPPPHDHDSRFELEIDSNAVIRRLRVVLDLQAKGYERFVPLADGLEWIEVVTEGTIHPQGCPPVAESGRVRAYVLDRKAAQGKRGVPRVRRDEAITFVAISAPLTEAEFTSRLDAKREPFRGPPRGKKRAWRANTGLGLRIDVPSGKRIDGEVGWRLRKYQEAFWAQAEFGGPLKVDDQDRIAWGDVAENGLQLGLLIRSKTRVLGDSPSCRICVRNAGDKDIEVALPAAFWPDHVSVVLTDGEGRAVRTRVASPWRASAPDIARQEKLAPGQTAVRSMPRFGLGQNLDDKRVGWHFDVAENTVYDLTIRLDAPCNRQLIDLPGVTVKLQVGDDRP